LKELTSVTRKTISLFLTFILTAGTLTTFSPSSSLSITDVYALSEVGKDNIECNNFNFNLNGLDTNSFLGSNVANGLTTHAQEESSSVNDNDEEITANSLVNDGQRNGQFKLD
jgi:hypothetical protein